LTGQLERRAEHQHSAALAHRLPWAGGETVENRQCEGGGFAGPSLRNSDHVAARYDRRYCLRLDRSWSEVLFLCERARDCVVKSEVAKGGQWGDFLCKCLRSRCAMRHGPALRVKKDTPARSGLSVKLKVRARSRLMGSVHAARRRPVDRRPTYEPSMRWFQAAVCYVARLAVPSLSFEEPVDRDRD